MDKRPYDPALVRGRSPLPATQQPDKDVGSKRTAATRTLSVRHKVGFFGALNLKTGGLITQEAPTFNSETFGEFIRYLLKSTHGKIYLILDNAKWHRAKVFKDFFESNQDRIVRIFLPPYSPELNPVERVWRITRRQVTHNPYFLSVEELRATLVAHFLRWEQPNCTLKILRANI